jgi:hypothetical protein
MKTYKRCTICKAKGERAGSYCRECLVTLKRISEAHETRRSEYSPRMAKVNGMDIGAVRAMAESTEGGEE